MIKKLFNTDLKVNLYTVLGVASVCFFVFEIMSKDFIFNKWALILGLLLLGYLFEFILGLFMEKVFPSFKYKGKRKTFSFAIFVGGLMFFFSAFGVYYNKRYCTDSKCDKYTVNDKITHRISRSDEHYYIVIKIKGDDTEIELEEDEWNDIRINRKIEICIAKGGLGFAIISHVYLY